MNRAAKGYLKFRSHGLEDPIFYINTASSVCVAASVLTSNSSTILKFTSFSILSEPIFYLFLKSKNINWIKNFFCYYILYKIYFSINIVNTITKNQASKYDIQFNYSGAGITYEDFLKILPPFGIKTAVIERNKKIFIL